MDIAGEEIFARDGNAHLEEGADQDQVAGLAAGAIGCGNVDVEVVDPKVLLTAFRWRFLNQYTHFIPPVDREEGKYPLHQYMRIMPGC